jgi:hypothetical protein
MAATAQAEVYLRSVLFSLAAENSDIFATPAPIGR